MSSNAVPGLDGSKADSASSRARTAALGSSSSLPVAADPDSRRRQRPSVGPGPPHQRRHHIQAPGVPARLLGVRCKPGGTGNYKRINYPLPVGCHARVGDSLAQFDQP